MVLPRCASRVTSDLRYEQSGLSTTLRSQPTRRRSSPMLPTRWCGLGCSRLDLRIASSELLGRLHRETYCPLTLRSRNRSDVFCIWQPSTGVRSPNSSGVSIRALDVCGKTDPPVNMVQQSLPSRMGRSIRVELENAGSHVWESH